MDLAQRLSLIEADRRVFVRKRTPGVRVCRTRLLPAAEVSGRCVSEFDKEADSTSSAQGLLLLPAA
jgi:hypothetical protein